jgi:hypothetical protein
MSSTTTLGIKVNIVKELFILIYTSMLGNLDMKVKFLMVSVFSSKPAFSTVLTILFVFDSLFANKS